MREEGGERKGERKERERESIMHVQGKRVRGI